ncbi:MAG: penicillin-binding protein activator [Desulfotignum sp.]
MKLPFFLLFRSMAWVMAVLFLSAVWGCAPKTVQKPADDVTSLETKKPEPGAKEQETAALVKILMAEAQKLLEQGRVKEAFSAYNQAAALAPEDPLNDEIVSDIELLLAKADPSSIQTFLQMENLAVPQPLLLYWLGVSHATAQEYADAMEVLTRFVTDFPDHVHTSDAKELLDLIKQTTFTKDTIGCLLPLSGKYGSYGQKALKGIQLAIQDLSNTYDRNFTIIVKDTQSDPEKAAAGVDELNQAHVMGIIGPILAVETAGARAQELQIPLIALTQKADFPLSGDYLFSNFITPQMQVETLAAYVFKKRGITKVAVLYPDERYGRLHMQMFRDMVDEYNGQMVGVEAYDGTRTDFADSIQKLIQEADLYAETAYPVGEVSYSGTTPVTGIQDGKGNTDPDQVKKKDIGFDALFIPDSVSRINMILPQLAFNDAKGMILLGTNLWHQQSLLAQTKGYNRNTVITDGYFGNSRKPATARFEKAFTELYKESPGFLEAISYDTVQILFLTAMDAAVDSRQRVRDALVEGRLFEGVTGTTIFDQTGAARKELFLITIKNNQFTEIGN